jgi:hypothetical protein
MKQSILFTSMSKFLYSTLIILTFIYLIPISITQTSTETVVKVDPSIISVVIGEKFTVNITVIDVQNLYGVEATVCWNASLLQLINVDIRLGVSSHPDGVLYEPFLNITQENVGEFIIGATSYTPAPSFNGSGNIMSMTFRVINVGESIIDLETKLYDYPPPDREPRESMPIPHTTIDGTINAIIPEIFSTTTFIILLILLTIILIVLRRAQENTRFSRQNFSEMNKTNIQKSKYQPQ